MCAEEVTLKHLLWTSLESWGQVTHELSRTEFSQLDADNLESVVSQYARTAMKIEKGISPNQVHGGARLRCIPAVICDLLVFSLKKACSPARTQACWSCDVL